MKTCASGSTWTFFAACYDISENERKVLVADLLELVDLQHRREDMVDKLSRGMKQRLSLARTLWRMIRKY